MSAQGLDQAARGVALFVAASQPFYPLGLWALGGWPAAKAGAVVLLVTPLFLLVPVVCRRNSAGGRFLLVVAGTLVTLFAAVALGTLSGVEAYHLPVLAVAAALFRRSEWRWRLAALALPAAARALGPAILPAAGWIDAQAATGLRCLHVFGAIVLSIYIGWQARAAWRS